MKTLIIDYGVSNLGSVSRAVEECGGKVFVNDYPKKSEKFEKIILPGVGSFHVGMKNLRDRGWPEFIKQFVLEKEIPILGICLGMQLLADSGEEGGETPGLGLISGQVEKLKSSEGGERIPHVGWNQIHQKRKDLLLEGVLPGADFYFVHSYHLVPTNKKDILATTPYCNNFVSVVNKKNIYGTQFHPEKSGLTGFMILKNFLSI